MWVPWSDMNLKPFESIYHVRGYDCGYGGPLKPLSLADFFQEAAGDHATALGIGMEKMFSLGRTWMLARIDIRIEALPRTGDHVTVRTWPAGTDRIFAMRCLELLDAEGRLLAGALYGYFIYDIVQRRPLRPERILDPAMKFDRPHPWPDLAPGLQDLAWDEEPWLPAFSLDVGPRHIDNNGHVNNAHFVEWLCDAVPAELRGSGETARITVDFISEAKAGERVEAFSRPAPGGEGVLSILKRDGETIARARTLWR